MKILVLNGSPRVKSDTMHITHAFLEGMNQARDCEIQTVDVIKKHISPCLGCFQCALSGSGTCIQHDDQNDILDAIKKADAVIWSFPLYFFSLPSHLKAVLDRTLPLGKMTMRMDNDRIVHDPLVPLPNQKHLMICGSGFPYFKNNFAAVKMLFHNVYRDVVTICVSETPLLSVPSLTRLTQPLLEKVTSAGVEFRKTGTVSEETIRLLQTPMIPADAYVAMCNSLHQ